MPTRVPGGILQQREVVCIHDPPPRKIERIRLVSGALLGCNDDGSLQMPPSYRASILVRNPFKKCRVLPERTNFGTLKIFGQPPNRSVNFEFLNSPQNCSASDGAHSSYLLLEPKVQPFDVSVGFNNQGETLDEATGLATDNEDFNAVAAQITANLARPPSMPEMEELYQRECSNSEEDDTTHSEVNQPNLVAVQAQPFTDHQARQTGDKPRRIMCLLSVIHCFQTTPRAKPYPVAVCEKLPHILFPIGKGNNGAPWQHQTHLRAVFDSGAGASLGYLPYFQDLHSKFPHLFLEFCSRNKPTTSLSIVRWKH